MDPNEYRSLYKQIESLIAGEKDIIASLSNVAAVLHHSLKPHWTGFYLVKQNELVLGPFQGPVACTRIAYGKGVCGKSWETGLPIIVDNVHEFEGHIACSPFSNSEIVLPIIQNNKVKGLLDIDSVEFAAFKTPELEFLTQVCTLVSTLFESETLEGN